MVFVSQVAGYNIQNITLDIIAYLVMGATNVYAHTQNHDALIELNLAINV